MSGAALIGLGGAALAFLVGWFAVLGTQAIRRRARIRKRISPFGELLAAGTAETAPTPVRVRERTSSTENPLVAGLSARYPLAGGVRTTLIAGIAGVLAFAVLVPVLSFFSFPTTLAFVTATLVGGGLGWNIGGVLEDGKRNEFSDRFLIALEDFHRMVRYGIASNQALKSITDAAEEPVKSSLRKIVLETEFGVPIGPAMDREARRVRIAELSMLAAVVSTQSATGGNLSESVANLAAMLRERLDNRSRMRASTAESRITMLILTFVPFAGIGLQAAMQPELIGVLMGEARHLLGIGIALIVAGLVISWFMIRSAQR